jgi:hypothetical protein
MIACIIAVAILLSLALLACVFAPALANPDHDDET